MARSFVAVNATAVIVAHSASLPVPRRLRSITLTSISDLGTVIVKTGGASGTTVLTLAAQTGVTVQWVGDAFLANGIHVTLAGTAVAVSVEWEV